MVLHLLSGHICMTLSRLVLARQIGGACCGQPTLSKILYRHLTKPYHLFLSAAPQVLQQQVILIHFYPESSLHGHDLMLSGQPGTQT